MTLKEYISERQAAGVASASVILAEITRPSETVEQFTEQEAKPAARLELEQAAIAAISALAALVAPNIPEGERLARVAALTAKQIRDVIRNALAGLTVANQREVQYLVAELQTYYAAAPDIWPPAPDFGQQTRTVQRTTRTLGPSWWETNFPGEPVPTRQHIRGLMQ